MTDHLISSFGQKPPALGQLRINPELGQDDARRPEEDGAQAGGPLRLAGRRTLRDQLRTFQISNAKKFRCYAAGDPRAGRHAMAIE